MKKHPTWEDFKKMILTYNVVSYLYTLSAKKKNLGGLTFSLVKWMPGNEELHGVGHCGLCHVYKDKDGMCSPKCPLVVETGINYQSNAECANICSEIVGAFDFYCDDGLKQKNVAEKAYALLLKLYNEELEKF